MLSLKWAIPEKIKEMEGGIGLRKPLKFLAYPWKSRTKQSFTPGNSTKLCYHALEAPWPKTKTPGNSTWFFLITPRKFSSFLFDHLNFHILFLQYPWEIPCPKPHCLDFFWNSPMWPPFFCEFPIYFQPWSLN